MFSSIFLANRHHLRDGLLKVFKQGTFNISSSIPAVRAAPKAGQAYLQK
jgi:hypothetical protein